MNRLTALHCFLVFLIGAQAQSFSWANAFEGSSCVGMAAVCDADGNVYACGNMNGLVDFDPGVGQAMSMSGGTNGSNFLVKFDPNGNYIWHIDVGGSGVEIPRSLALDNNGGLLMAGRFGSFFDWDTSADTTTISPAAGTDGFIAKYDTSGQFLWVQNIGGASQDEAYGVAVDSNNDVYVTGWYADDVDFDNGPGVALLTVPSNHAQDAFLVKYDAQGNFMWVSGINGADSQIGKSVACGPNNEVYVHGNFSGSGTTFTADTSVSLLSAGTFDTFIAKFTSAGSLTWVKRMGGTDGDIAEVIRADANNFIYLSGSYRDTVDLDPGAGVDIAVSQGPGADVYFSKLDSAGNAIWAHSVRGNNHFDGVSDLTVDASGNVFITGAFSVQQDFDPSGDSTILSPVMANDLYVAKYLAGGSLSWAKPIFTDGVFDTANGLTTDALGNVFVTGTFSDTAVFDNLMAGGVQTGTSSAFFLAKYGDDISTSVTQKKQDNQFVVYPNPTRADVRWRTTQLVEKPRLAIYTLQGVLVKSWNENIPEQFSVADFAKGPYVVQLRHRNGVLNTHLLIQ